MTRPERRVDVQSWALRTALLAVLIAAALWFYGLGAGGTFYFRVAQAPLRAAGDAPYYRESLLHVGLAHVLGLGGSLLAFRLFVLGGFWLAVLYLGSVVQRRLSPLDATLVLLVLAFHPTAMIAHAWTCHPDALTYLLTALLMFTRRPWVAAAIAAIGAWNHLEMWLVICVQTVLLWLAFAEPRARGRALALGLGLVVGAASCKLTLWLCGVYVAESRVALAAGQRAAVLASHWTGAGWPVLYTLHFAHLLWLPCVIAALARRSRAAALAVVASQLLALAAAFFTQDTTRVFAFLAWGSLLYGLVHALEQQGRRQPPERSRVDLRWLVAAAVVVTIAAPKIFAWKGAVHDTSRAREHLRALVAGR